jgi:hypothetical protein
MFLNPDTGIWHGDLGGFVKVGEGEQTWLCSGH